MARNSGKGERSAGLQRLALLGFGALLVVLFLVFAIAQGIGNPSVPSDAVAVVEDAPEGLGTITQEEFDRALAQAAEGAGVSPVPKPGDERYDELMEASMSEIIDIVWIQGQAEEMGLSVTPREVLKELDKLKDQSFNGEKQYREFLKEKKFSREDILTRVKIQMLTTQIQEQVAEEASVPSSSEVEAYYEAAKATQYTTPESRDIRVIKNKDKSKVEAAKAALEKDDSNQSWAKVAKKYSTDTTKGNGGLQSAVAEGTLGEPLDAAVFAAPQGEIEGPLREGSTWVVFEVMKVTPQKVQSLDEAKSQISAQLAEQANEQTLQSFVRSYSSRWTSRTFCDPDFAVAKCSNFEAGPPAEVNPACFEADPKTPPEACPAPVTQTRPANPGTVNPLTPEGQRLAQRPRPAGDEEAAAVAPEGEIPGGVPGEVPGEAPGEAPPPAEGN